MRGGGCGGKRQAEVVEQQLHVAARFGAAHEEEFPAVGGGDSDVEHLHGREFFEDCARHQAAGDGAQLLAQRDREAVGEKGDEQVRLDPLGQLVKDRPQAEVALQGAERFLHKTQLHIAAPDQLRIVGAQVGAQQIATFAAAHGAQFFAVESIGERAVGRDGDLHQTRRAAAGFFLRGAEFGEQRVAGRALPLEFAEASPVSFEPAAAHAAFLAGAGLTLGEHVEFAVLREEFDAQLRAHFPPGPPGERGFVAGEPGLGRADEITHGGVGGAQLGEDLLGGNAAIHNPNTLGGAEAAADRGEHVAQGGLVGGVARQHLVGERQAFGRDDEGDDDLDAVPALVAAVAEAAGIVRVVRHGALEVGAREVVEQHFVARAEEIAPALAQMGEEFLFVREQQVVTAVEGVVLRGTGVDAEQVGERRSGEPVTVQPPFAAGREEPVDHEDAENFFPIGVFAADGQTRPEKIVELQRAPELVGEPARAPLAGMCEAELVEPHLHGRGAVGGRRAVGGKERELARLAAGLVEDREAALPGEALAVVDLAEIEHVALRDLAARIPVALDDGPRPVDFTVLAPLAALQEHAGSLPEPAAAG
jgi:hypothetical protein